MVLGQLKSVRAGRTLARTPGSNERVDASANCAAQVGQKSVLPMKALNFLRKFIGRLFLVLGMLLLCIAAIFGTED